MRQWLPPTYLPRRSTAIVVTLLVCLVCLNPVALFAQGGQSDDVNPPKPTVPIVIAAEVQAPDSPTISGGHEAEPGAWSWQARLVVRSIYDPGYLYQFCGGTLVAPNWVLTAASCVDYRPAGQIDVYLGQDTLPAADGEVIAAADIVRHPDYGTVVAAHYPAPSEDDYLRHLTRPANVALIRLAEASTQEPIALNTSAEDEETAFVSGTVIGFADQNYRLFQVALPLVPESVCNGDDMYRGYMSEDMLCAGYAKGIKDACYEDGGGPLIAYGQAADRWLQIGVVGIEPGCGYSQRFGLYARVSSYADWVQACIADAESGTCVGGDKFEADNDPAQATLLPTDGVSQTHSFHNAADRDWLMFEAKGGATYIIETQALGAASDTLLWLYDSNGKSALAYNDDGGLGTASRLVWRAPRNDTFYVEVQDYVGAIRDQAAYGVAITELEHTAHLPLIPHTLIAEPE